MSTTTPFKPNTSPASGTPVSGSPKFQKSLTSLKMSVSASNLLAPRSDAPMSPFDPLRTAQSTSSINIASQAEPEFQSNKSTNSDEISTVGDLFEKSFKSFASSEYGSETSLDAAVKKKPSFVTESSSPSRKTTHLNVSTYRKIQLNRNKFNVTSPGGETGLGPWNEDNVPSPILQRKFTIMSSNVQKVHIVTIGKHNDEDVRRIKIYEHEIPSTQWDLTTINHNLSEDPASALILLDSHLRNPKNENKLVDKVLPKLAAIKALAGAQTTLQSLYGGWLTSYVGKEDEGIHASSQSVFVVSHSPQSGTVARSLKDLPRNATREDVKNHIRMHLGKMIDKLYLREASLGISFALVVPLGKTGINYFS